jgi:Leucine-rich repeat (LRR) protein
MGQDESLPLLPSKTQEITSASIDLGSIPFFIPPDHPIQSIVLRNVPLSKFPTELVNLKRLDIQYCDLSSQSTQISSTTFHFPRVESFTLAQNSLQHLPESITTMRELLSLIIVANKLTTVPSLSFAPLKEVDFFVNLLSSVPEGIPNSVLNLRLSFNNIVSIDLRLPNLLRLQVSGNLVEMFSENCSFVSLQKLDLSFNKLSEINNLSQICPKLKTLNLSYNFLTKFPSKLPLSIENVDISYNKLATFEDNLTQYSRLITLDLRNNPLTELPILPRSIRELNLENVPFEIVDPFPRLTIQIVNFKRSQFTTLPDFHESSIKFLRIFSSNLRSILSDFLPSSLKILDLSYNGITELDPSIFRLSKLRHLRVNGNRISIIPPQFSQSHLIGFSICLNPLSILPPLPHSLETLECTKCEFSEVPTLKSGLTFVSFAGNHLTTLSEIPEATHVNFSLNELSVIPTCPNCVRVADFSHNSLRVFTLTTGFISVDVSHNSLINLIVENDMIGCPSLEILKLSHNPECQFAVDFSRYPKLTHLDVCGTEINHPFPLPERLIELVLATP